MSKPCEDQLASSRSPPYRIALVPTYSERYEAGKAGAFSLFIHEVMPYSRYRAGTVVYGRPTEHPFEGDPFHPVLPAGPLWLSRNRRFGVGVWQALKGDAPDLVEVFNRPETFLAIAARAPTVKLALHLGNDPLGMRRARSAKVRRKILERASAVFCCSRFICDRFLDGLEAPRDNVIALYAGAVRPTVRPQKQKRIAYVGRMIEEKGVAELAEAAARVLADRPDWSLDLVGSNRPGEGGGTTPYEARVAALLKPVEAQVRFHGFVPAARVGEILADAAIAVVPSKWDEPMGRTAIEALAAGCAVVAAARGGLPELVEGRGELLSVVSADAIVASLVRLVDDETYRRGLQDAAWRDFPFDLHKFVERYDDLRAAAIARPLRAGFATRGALV